MPARLRLGLTWRLLLAFAALIIPLVLFAAWSFGSSFQERRNAALDDAVSAAQTTAALVHDLLRDLSGTSLAMALALGAQEGPLDQVTAGPYLTAISQRYPLVRAMFLTDTIGRVVAAQRGEGVGFDVSARPYTRTLLGGQDFVLTDAVVGVQTGEPTVTMARTVRAPDDALRGLLVIAFYPGQLTELFPRELPTDASIIVFDRRGQVIYSNNLSDLPPDQRDQGSSPLVQAALAGNVVRTRGSVGLDGQSRLGAVVPVREYGWAAGFSRTTAAVDAPLRRLYRRQLLGLGGVTFGAMLIALLLSRQLTRPLARLAVQARTFGRGDPPNPVPVTGPVEVQALAVALNTMAAEVAARFAEREAAEARYRGIFDHAVEGIFQTGFDGRFRTVNPAGARLLGYDSPEELMAAVPDVRQLYVDPRQLDTYLRQMQADGEVSNFEFQVRRRDGSAVWVSLNARATYDADGRINAVEGMVSDISDRKRAEADREQRLRWEQEAREAAEAANRAMDEFLSVLSHELRTPLTSILGFTQLLQRHKGGDEAMLTHALELIDRNARAQVRLVADLLDVSSIITGKLTLSLRLTTLEPIVQAALDAVRPMATVKGIALTAELDPTAGAVRGDADRLQQVVGNLLTNAVKFTPDGGRVTVRLTQVGTEACITVSDTGIGIPPEFLPQVFERFRQADPSSTRMHGGLGLGLSIVRTLTELHGGRVTAASEGKACGATFTVWLPLAAPQQPQPGQDSRESEAAAAIPSASLSGVHVLVVEDQDDTRSFLHLLLEADGARVTEAATAAAATDALRTACPDVLLVDIGMPDEDGYTFIRRVRQRTPAEGGTAPALALTAYAGPEDRRRALAAGFDEHMAKPVDTAALLATLAQLVHGRRLTHG